MVCFFVGLDLMFYGAAGGRIPDSPFCYYYFIGAFLIGLGYNSDLAK